jgi:hypothetical protein
MADRSQNPARIVMSGDRDGHVPFAVVNVKLLRVEKRLLISGVVANTLNKQWRIADKRWSSRLGVGRDAYKSFPKKNLALLRNIYICFGPGLIIWRNGINVKLLWSAVLFWGMEVCIHLFLM